MKALVLCGGYGTRLGKLTKNTPKPMIKVGGKPVLEHIVDYLNRFGITEIMVKTHYKPEVIMKHLGTRVVYYYEPRLRDSKTSAMSVHRWLGDRYIVWNGDTLTNVNLAQMMSLPSPVRFMVNGVYGGIQIWEDSCYQVPYTETDASFFDMGTLEGLKKARKFYK